VAIVTGGARETGRAIAFALAADGADIAITYLSNREAAEATAAEITATGARAMAVQADCTDPASARAMVETVVAAFGRLDILVNNAGARARSPIADITVEDWDRVFSVNTKGVFVASVAAGREMMRQGSGVIINIAGASAHRSYPLAGPYGPSKAAVVSLTKQMALEWAPHGIRVNGVSPGPIREPDSGWQALEPRLVAQAQKIPLRRVGTPEDVAHAVRYLASPAADYVTGHMLLVDGGSAETWYVFP
jgi:NAD(P)-dependent dehydrogenase (short-subunit alcohol dehydrogenase family)